MKLTRWLPAVALAYCAALHATDYQLAPVDALFADGESSCPTFLFALAGTQPQAAGQQGPWFAVPRSNPSYNEIVSAVMLAKASNGTVFVRTKGAVFPGCAAEEVVYVVTK